MLIVPQCDFTITAHQHTLSCVDAPLLLSDCTLSLFIITLIRCTESAMKMMMNSGKSHQKTRKLEGLLHMCVLIDFGRFFLITFFCVLMNIITIAHTLTHNDIRQSTLPIYLRVLQAFEMHILLHTLNFISLLETVEVLKLRQALFLNYSVQIYQMETNTCTNARTSDFNETLGNIEYLFYNKTDTLTQKAMALLKCSIHGCTYGTSSSAINAAEMHRNDAKHTKPFECGFEDAGLSAFIHEEDCTETLLNVDVERKKVHGEIPLEATDAEKTQTTRNFFLTLALTHTDLAAHETRRKRSL